MKTYIKPEVEYINFASENVATTVIIPTTSKDNDGDL